MIELKVTGENINEVWEQLQLKVCFPQMEREPAVETVETTVQVAEEAPAETAPPVAEDIPEETPTYTEEEVRKALLNLKAEHGNTAIRTILNKFGVSNFKSIIPGQYHAVMESVKNYKEEE